jgi:hypothetical protein
MQTSIAVPQAFSVRDEHELYPFQHLISRLNPDLRVVQIATGVHVHGGCTVFWGLVYQDGQELTKEDVEQALKQAGFDCAHGGAIQLPKPKGCCKTPAAPAK